MNEHWLPVHTPQSIGKSLRVTQFSLLALSALFAVGACSRIPGANDAPSYSPNEGIRHISNAPPVEWDVALNETMDDFTVPVVMRGNKDMVGLITHSPHRISIHSIADRGSVLDERPFSVPTEVEGQLKRPTSMPVDLVDFDSSRTLWVLDGGTSQIVGEGADGYQRTIGTVRAASGAGVSANISEVSTRSGCRVEPNKLVLLSNDSSIDLMEVDIRTFKETRRYSQATIDSSMLTNPASLRFAGSAPGPCVLWSPTGSVFALWYRGAWQRIPRIKDALSDSTSNSTGNNTINNGAGSSPQRVGSESSPKTDILSATSFAGGVVFLAGTKGEEQGRLLDIYRSNGVYIETLRLNQPATLIAGAGERLILLSKRGKEWYLTSMVLPARY